MGRSNGTFPSYVRLDLDHRQPPDGWKDGARKCIECGRNWPNVAAFVPTPCCDKVGGIVMDAVPDMTWPEAVSALLHFRFNRYYEKWNEGMSDAELNWSQEFPVNDDEVSEGMKEIEEFLSDLEQSNFQV